ncbi:hypothetical protein L4174_023640 (plasmid) [Photobacterium sp. CCB-ST2H9]|uniref:hypothetical protein n=1 Tax=Photobacterium sp. CCB-ST2H9 TaxID=2912855 RepID=UPI0020062ED6|nr:hypothetical protein [Photobacterium sp. CCB-ST2H9]UTM60462.1 hypothetical protein L4174_023640 [Photobacterium sp. CCB-ST2H9]
MSKIEIRRALAAKNIKPSSLSYKRASPTSKGPASGWSIGFSEEMEEALRAAGYQGEMDPEAADTGEMLEWIEILPELEPQYRDDQ